MALAWERTAAFARERHVFGRPLAKHQVTRHKLADLATSVYTCRCVTYDALRRFVAGEEPLKEVTMAKLLTQRASYELMDACLQIHGGAGYMREYWVERAARDARLGPIGGGSDEIMREILGRSSGSDSRLNPAGGGREGARPSPLRSSGAPSGSDARAVAPAPQLAPHHAPAPTGR